MKGHETKSSLNIILIKVCLNYVNLEVVTVLWKVTLTKNFEKFLRTLYELKKY